MFKRRLKLALKIFAAIVLFVLLFLLFERVRGQISLARCKQTLIGRGARLSAKDFKRTVLASENGAPQFFKKVRELQDGDALTKFSPPAMQVLPSGRAVIGFREDVWIEDKMTNDWGAVSTILQSNRQVLAELREALWHPALDNSLDLSLGSKLGLLHLAPAKTTTRWFGPAAQLALRNGDSQLALTNLLCEIRLSELLAGDHLLISELVRIAILSISKETMWEALQWDGWSDSELAMLQTAWREKVFLNAMSKSLEGDRIFSDAGYDLMRRSNEEAARMLFWMDDYLEFGEQEPSSWEKCIRRLPGGEGLAKFLKHQVYCRIWRFAWSHQDQCRTLREFQELIDICHAAETGKSFLSIQGAIEKFNRQRTNKTTYEKLRFPDSESIFTVSSVVRKAMRAETERSMILAALAVKRYQIKNKALPDSFSVLIPDFLPALPIDYMDGKPLRYQAKSSDGFLLYSVGDDGKDDGGDLGVPSENGASRNLWKRPDFVWPAPAHPEELESWRKQ